MEVETAAEFTNTWKRVKSIWQSASATGFDKDYENTTHFKNSHFTQIHLVNPSCKDLTIQTLQKLAWKYQLRAADTCKASPALLVFAGNCILSCQRLWGVPRKCHSPSRVVTSLQGHHSEVWDTVQSTRHYLLGIAVGSHFIWRWHQDWPFFLKGFQSKAWSISEAKKPQGTHTTPLVFIFKFMDYTPRVSSAAQLNTILFWHAQDCFHTHCGAAGD